MFFLNWPRKRKAEKQRKREEDLRSHWKYTRKKLEEAIRAAERYAAEGPLEPYPSKGSLDWHSLDQMERDGYKPSSWLFQGERYDPCIMVGTAPPDIMELRRRLQSLWAAIRRRELWNDICQSRFYREHH